MTDDLDLGARVRRPVPGAEQLEDLDPHLGLRRNSVSDGVGLELRRTGVLATHEERSELRPDGARIRD